VPAIAIVDDRKNDRETIQRVVASTVKKLNEAENWQVVSDEPPSIEKDIIPWLDENDATVLVTDWRLNEGAQSQRVVNYEADRLIGALRAKRPTFPIFVITGYENEARAHLRDVENIFNRQYFAKNADNIVPQMIRAGLRRYDEQRNLLTRMDILARKVAKGKALPKDRAELESLHGYFQAELPSIISLDGVLAEFEEIQKKSEALRQKIDRRLNKEKKAN
jgi:hypothetical protein